MKKITLFVLLMMLCTIISGCRSKGTAVEKQEKVELVYYGLYDDGEIFDPLIKEFQDKHPNVTINYKQFTNIEEYENLIVNELAEGEGPDIFSIHNTWVLKHQNKISPAPSSLSPADFRDVFVNVCAEDLIRVDKDNTEKVYALPLFVDSLALYYNKALFEEKIPERGKPASTWEEIKEDVYKLTKQDNSFEKFETSGIAMGRADNILRAADILYLLMIQNGVEFYDETYSNASFSSSSSNKKAALEALQLFTSFGISGNKNYSWNDTISDSSSLDKEIMPFVKGKTAMIIGYSYLYDEIVSELEIQGKKGYTMKKSDVKVSSIPQVFTSTSDTKNLKAAYADYFAQTVSRNSENPDMAWEFLEFLVNKENSKYYHEKTNRPTARRDLIEEQKQEPTYGVFAAQSGYAKSFVILDDAKYNTIFSDSITCVLNGTKPEDALKKAEEEINILLPSDILSRMEMTEEEK